MATETDPLFHVVLFQPQIPNNTGNIGRTCMTTGCRLHLIHPLGFQMDEKAKRRAGLDYWHHVDCVEHADWESYLCKAQPRRLWLYTTSSARPHWQAPFERGDHLVFGQENGGVPPWLHEWIDQHQGPSHRLTLPMRPLPEARSLNLATAVACGVFEGLRQVSGPGLPWPDGCGVANRITN